MTWTGWLLFVALWSAVGVAAVFFLLHRRGFRENVWYLIGAVIGPLLVPVALERSRRRSSSVEHGPAPGSVRGDGLTVLVGVDGSAESEQAVADAARLVGPAAGRVLVATVIGVDEAEEADATAREDARRLLADTAATLAGSGVRCCETHLLCGRPADALAELAAAEGADLVVVGRRGRGLSRALLGSAAERLGHGCSVPVLLAGKVGDRHRPAQHR
ncbi:universal stress protein [Trujillonella humicola]|uniref:universal stress protein n=1 Tax=Trujillonella humicola TaxID=3383699 RepID=UPI00390653D6